MLCDTGIAFSFGDEYGYYVPLPCIPSLALTLALDLPCSEGVEGITDTSPPSLSSPHVPSHTHPSTVLPSRATDYTHNMNRNPASINDLMTNPATVRSNTAASAQEWDPSVLVCRYVGFPLILNKCPYLKSKVCVTLTNDKLQHNCKSEDASRIEVQGPALEPPRSYKEWALQLKQREQNATHMKKKSDDNEEEKKGNKGKGKVLGLLNQKSTSSTACSNPLSCASRHWARACRTAMLLEWRRGACAEWRVVNELMSSDRVTKVSRCMPIRI